MSPLGIAIQLRLLVHAALDRDDMPEVCRLNRLADGAYVHLGPTDAGVYLAWARRYIPKDFYLGRGDA